MPAPFSGVFAATVTPFTRDARELDLEWIQGHLAYLEQHGADGVLALGTTGEGPSLAFPERQQVIDTVIRHKGKLWAFIGSGCASLTETIDISRYAWQAGAEAVLIVPPFYFKEIDDAGLVAYYDAVFAALPASAKVLLYNIPAMSGVEITDALVDYLGEKYPQKLVGIKDTSGRLPRLRRYVRRYPKLAIFTGSDALIAEGFRAGATGAISAVANVFPHYLKEMREAFLAGESMDEGQGAINRIRDILNAYPAIAAVKHLLHLVAGLPLTYVRPPLRNLSEEEGRKLAAQLKQAALP